MAKRFDHRWHSECRLLRWRAVLRWNWFRVSSSFCMTITTICRWLEKLQTKTEWLLGYAKSFGIPASRVAKPVETLFDKNCHICHFRNLKFYVEKGLTVKRLHRVLQFAQSCWLGNYIYKNTALRKKAKTDFDKKISSYFQTPALVRQWKIFEIVDKPSFCPLNVRRKPAH